MGQTESVHHPPGRSVTPAGASSAWAFPHQPEEVSPPAAGRDGAGKNIFAEQEVEIKNKGEARQPGEGGGPHCLALAMGLDRDPRGQHPTGMGVGSLRVGDLWPRQESLLL